MSRLTAPSERLYSEFLMGPTFRETPEVRHVPTLVKIEDPMLPVDQVVELLDEATKHGRIANSWLRRRAHRRLALTQGGDVALEGRACCMRLSRQIDRQLGHFPIPKEFRCEECGALWRVEMRVREGWR
jgi:hypothetical protein